MSNSTCFVLECRTGLALKWTASKLSHQRVGGHIREDEDQQNHCMKHETSSASSTVFIVYEGGSCSSSKGLLCNLCWRDPKEAVRDPHNLLEPTMFPRLAQSN